MHPKAPAKKSSFYGAGTGKKEDRFFKNSQIRAGLFKIGLSFFMPAIVIFIS